MKKLFLDLEGTLIDDIDNCNIVARSLAKVKAFIKAWQPDEIETFSWAFWDASDLAKWNSIAAWLKKELEREGELLPPKGRSFLLQRANLLKKGLKSRGSLSTGVNSRSSCGIYSHRGVSHKGVPGLGYRPDML